MLKNRILVVDDSEDMRALMSLLFVPEGYKVSVASDGSEALLQLASENLPDLIFLDHNMEKMSGPEFLAELERSFPEILGRVPIILLTGRENVVETRATEIVAKQVGIDPLIALAKKYLQ